MEENMERDLGDWEMNFKPDDEGKHPSWMLRYR